MIMASMMVESAAILSGGFGGYDISLRLSRPPSDSHPERMRGAVLDLFLSTDRRCRIIRCPTVH